MTEIPPFYPLPTAQVQPYVDAVGVEDTIEILLAFGGAELSLSADPRGQSMVERLVGLNKSIALTEMAATSNVMQKRVPIANRWLAQCLYAQGLSKAAIARRLRITDVTVGHYVAGRNAPNPRATFHVCKSD